MNTTKITNTVSEAVQTLFEIAKPQPGQLLVLGCSTSEIQGCRIGSQSSQEIARAVLAGLLPAAGEAGVYLAVQGCEHINRALCLSRECAQAYGLREVWVRPWLRAGGACVTEALEQLPDAVMVEDLGARAVLGLDIGGTMIGMHMRPVAVPVKAGPRAVGEAALTLAYARPKYIGGPRAQYAEEQFVH
ncbi:MAG: TIGR01440 family protein [Clostridiales bacterium]|nr:TIGR01440 family protein [Clostridiales bacterium]